MAKFLAHLGLRRKDASEPPPSSGYARVSLGELELWDLLRIDQVISDGPLVFNPVSPPGYGFLTEYCVFDCPEGGEPLWIGLLPESVHAHEGTIPFLYRGKLLLGVEVSAEVLMTMNHDCDVK